MAHKGSVKGRVNESTSRSTTSSANAGESMADKVESEPNPRSGLDRGTPPFTVKERPATKDYRSFAANMFGTAAFKMLEWLTPGAIQEMSRQAAQFRTDNQASTPSRNEHEPKSPSVQTKAMDEKQTACPTKDPSDASTKQTQAPQNVSDFAIESCTTLSTEMEKPASRDSATTDQARVDGGPESVREKDDPNNRWQQSGVRSTAKRRNSNARVRTSAAKPKRQLSIDPYPQEGISDESISPNMVRSPGWGTYNEKTPRAVKSGNATIPRPISQLTTAGYFDDVSLEKMPPPKPTEVKAKLGRSQMDGTKSSGSSSPKEVVAASPRIPSGASSSDQSQEAETPESESSLQGFYPQALRRLDAEAIDFLCDVVQDLNLQYEDHLLEPQTVVPFHIKQQGQSKPLKRRISSKHVTTVKEASEWNYFIEQTLFYVLSDPRRAIQSFTKKGSLYDSQTLWYCMLRLTRIGPSLVFHSLWLAAAGLFAPPKSVQTLRTPTAKLFPIQKEALSNEEAGWLMSICLHALVAAAPLVSEPMQLYDMSRIRSHGLSLAGSGAVARQPAELCLQYDDTFSNDLAMRLARRLFAAITARRCFDDLSESNLGVKAEPDILEPLFSQLDFFDMDAVYIFNFSVNDRALHETRVPTLLLDWARAVMIHDWDGNPEVPGDGPFGGALSLIEAMCK